MLLKRRLMFLGMEADVFLPRPQKHRPKTSMKIKKKIYFNVKKC